MDGNLAMAITGGSVSIAAIVVAVVKWSFGRNVQQADATVAALQLESAKVRAELTALKEKHDNELAQLERKLIDAAHKSEMESTSTSNKVAHLTTSIGELKGLTGSLGALLDQNRDKMSEFYRAELGKLEQNFRQELSRHIHPDLPERVTKLEAAMPKRKK